MRNYINIVEDQRQTFTQTELADYFAKPVLYKKVGTVDARLAVNKEMIATIIDGEIETINYARADDAVIRGVQGEEYILNADKFMDRYDGPELTSEYQSYKATGTTYAVMWNDGRAQFKASWGEMMIINNGDFLCSTTEEPDGDLYRIEGETFDETYKEIYDE